MAIGNLEVTLKLGNTEFFVNCEKDSFRIMPQKSHRYGYGLILRVVGNKATFSTELSRQIIEEKDSIYWPILKAFYKDEECVVIGGENKNNPQGRMLLESSDRICDLSRSYIKVSIEASPSGIVDQEITIDLAKYPEVKEACAVWQTMYERIQGNQAGNIQGQTSESQEIVSKYKQDGNESEKTTDKTAGYSGASELKGKMGASGKHSEHAEDKEAPVKDVRAHHA